MDILALTPMEHLEEVETDGIKASIGDCLKVGKRDPGVPVLLEDIPSVGYLLAEGVLVHDALLSLEDGRCNPSSILQSASGWVIWRRWTHGSNTSHPPILTPRTFSEPKLKPTCLFRMGEL